MSLLALWFACSVGPGPAATFDQALDDFAAATARHGDDVGREVDRDAIARLEDEYWAQCESTWETMSDCMASFSRCDDGRGGMGGGMGMDGWDALTADLWDAMQAHRDASAACGSAACCHDEEDRWQDLMSDAMDEMRDTDRGWSDDCGW